MAVLSLRLSPPLHSASLRRVSDASVATISQLGRRSLQWRRLVLCRGRVSRYKSLDDDYFYEEKEEEEEDELNDELDDDLDYDDLSDFEEEYDSESDIKRGNKKPQKRPQKSPHGKKNEDKFIDISDDDKVPKKKSKSKSKSKPKDCISSKKDLMDIGSLAEPKNVNFSKERFETLQEDLNFDPKWYPLINYLSTFGLKETHFSQMFERHIQCFNTSLTSAKEKVVLLTTIGVKSSDLKRMLVRQPQILEYSVQNLYSHIEFLVSIGVQNEKLGQVISSTPSFFSYSIEQSLKPTIKYLIEEVGIKEGEIGKVVQLSPQILVLRIENSWKSRYFFFSKELGAPKYTVAKMVSKHPQFLHYSIENGILPRINFFRSVGMKDSEILKVITNLSQILSLSLEGNLKPKYYYLINELKNEVNAITKYPTYLSLSLEQRIKPRHTFLVFLKKAPQKGPFPMRSLILSDSSFCKQWAGTSVEMYLEFRERLLSDELNRKMEKKKFTERRKVGIQKEVVKSGFW